MSRLPLLSQFAESYGIDFFIQREFEVTFLDLSFLIDGPKARKLYNDELKIPGCEILVIRSNGELDDFVKECSGTTIFIDFVGGLSEYDLTIGHIFRILKKYKAKYYLISNGDQPIPNKIEYGLNSSSWQKIKKVLKKPKLMFTFITRKIIVKLIKLDLLYQRPHRIFGIKESSSLGRYLEKYRINSYAFIPINSRDYDTYLEYKRARGHSLQTTETCVFIDQDNTNHPDFFLLGIPPLNANSYISSMNLLFDHIEKKTGLSVVIAAHPKSRFSSENHPYGTRLFLKGKTIDLIAKSRMAVTHASTSISFPVLFCKPIVLVVTDEMKKRSDMIATVNAFANELDLSYMDVDSPDEVDAFKIDLDIQPKYEKYLYAYVKNKEPINKLTWEIVAEAVLQD